MTGRLWGRFALVGLFWLAMVVWVVIDLQKTYRRDMRGAEQVGAVSTRLLEGHMLSVTQKVNTRLSEFVFYFQRDIAAGVNRERIQVSLRRDLLMFPEVRGFQVMDAKGGYLFVDEGLSIPVHLEAPEFFQELRDNPEAGMVVSRPLQSGVTDEWLIMFGHRLVDAKGQFIGIVAIAVRCRFFEEFARDLKLAAGNTAALWGRDVLVTRWPMIPERAGVPLEKTSFSAAFAPEKMEGSFIQADYWDGVRRVFYFRNMKGIGLPFVVVLGQDENQILTEWRQRAITYAILGGIITVMLLVLIRDWLSGYRRMEMQVAQSSRKAEEKSYEGRALLDSIPDAAWMVDMESRYLAVNEIFCQKNGLKMEDVIGRKPSEIFPFEEDVLALDQGRHDTLELKAPTEQIIWFHLGGERVPMELRRVPIFDGKGNIRALAGIARNISSRYEMESRQYLLSQLFENNSEGLLVLDEREKIVIVNQAFADTIGYSQEEILGQRPRDFFSRRHDRIFIEDAIWQLNTHGTWAGELWLLHKCGKEVPVDCRILPLVDQLKRTSWIVFMRNLSERKASEAHIDALANMDILTGLPNRNSFTRSLEDHLKTNSVSAMLTMDLDKLSRINDAYGHMAGDFLLRRIGKRMRRLLREQDVIGRLGDDQFGVLVCNIDPHGVETVVEKLLGMLSRPFVVEGKAISCTACIGICLVPADGNTAEAILRNADTAMHNARSLGPNSYRFFSQEMNVRLTEHLNREISLRNALKAHEFRLYYQPQVDIESRRIVGCEALLRWAPPGKEIVPPQEFIPLAEETGLILPIGKWVLEEACRQNKAWQDQGLPPIVMAVNLSAVQFQDNQLIDNVVHALNDSGLDACWLELEITESVLMQAPDLVVKILEDLKALGIRLSIDDFGTGYSSLAYLKRFPVDKIKIDRSFIQDLCTDADDAVIVRMVLGMVRELCLSAIAEGVENEAQLGFLIDCQCHEYQGYLCSKPVPAPEFEVLLKQAGQDGRQEI